MNELEDIFRLLNSFFSKLVGHNHESHQYSQVSYDNVSGDPVSRAMEWVNAGVIYHGATNGQQDPICGGTVKRSSNEPWKQYRTDCSGLICWAFGIKPFYGSKGFAPFSNAVSYAIPVGDLKPGDALNSGHHMMLFAGWENEDNLTAKVIQSTTCKKAVSLDTIKFKRIGQKMLETPGGMRLVAIRKR